jgi:hypothetical protein
MSAPPPIIFTVTDAGRQAALDALNTGLTLRLTHIALGSGTYAPDGTETTLQDELGRWPLSGGDVEPNSNTLRFFSSVVSATSFDAFEAGLFDENNVLFAVASRTNGIPLIPVHANIAFLGAYGLKLNNLPANAVSVVTDPNTALAAMLLLQHTTHPNPHPQYALLNQFLAAIQSIQERLSIVEMTFIVNFINQQLVPRLQGLLSYQGQIEYVGVAMTAAQFTAAKADGSVWQVYAEGQFLLGAKAGEFALNSTGGSKTATLTLQNLPPHTHTQMASSDQTVGEPNKTAPVTDAGTTGSTKTVGVTTDDFFSTTFNPLQTGSTGGAGGVAQPFDTLPPYTVAHCFICVTPASEIQPLAFPTP